MHRSQKILAVTFDVGGTLIEPWPSVGHVYAEVAARHGAGQLSPEILNRRFAAAWRAHPGFDYNVGDWSAIVDTTFADLIADKPSRTFFPELYERFAQAGAWKIFEDVLPTLATLAERGVRLAVISNWDNRLRPLLTSLNLAHYFETIVVSCEVGASKPSPATFQAAAKALSLPPDKILHVGDSFEMDVFGARAAGLQALQITRNQNVADTGQIGSLRELAASVSAERAWR